MARGWLMMIGQHAMVNDGTLAARRPMSRTLLVHSGRGQMC